MATDSLELVTKYHEAFWLAKLSGAAIGITAAGVVYQTQVHARNMGAIGVALLISIALALSAVGRLKAADNCAKEVGWYESVGGNPDEE